jgi:hypothetical protein
MQIISEIIFGTGTGTAYVKLVPFIFGSIIS